MLKNDRPWFHGFKIFTFVWMIFVIIGSIKVAPEATGFVSTSRVVFFHVPVAWVAVLAFLVSAVFSIRYLRKKQMEDDIWASSSAALGFLFAILATVTGSMWAKHEWGSYWNWDPRETSIVILLLIYAAYFALRSAIDSQETKAQLSAVYSILAFVTVPFLIFVVPRVIFTLHPQNPIFTNEPKQRMTPSIRWVFFASLFGFTLVYYWILRLKVDIERIKHRMTEMEDKS
jgi:heme exporter protein C